MKYLNGMLVSIPNVVVFVLYSCINNLIQMWYGVVDRTDREVLRVEGLNNVAVVTVQRPLDRDSMPANMSDIYHLTVKLHLYKAYFFRLE